MSSSLPRMSLGRRLCEGTGLLPLAAIVGSLLGCTPAPPSAVAEEARSQSRVDLEQPKLASRAVDGLEIGLFLNKDSYRMGERVDARLVFRNTGRQDILFPIGPDGANYANDLLLEYVVLASWGQGYMSESPWDLAAEHPYEDLGLIRLKPGKDHVLNVNGIIPLNRRVVGEMRSYYCVAAIFRAYATTQTLQRRLGVDPGGARIWKGMVISNWAVIREIEH